MFLYLLCCVVILLSIGLCSKCLNSVFYFLVQILNLLFCKRPNCCCINLILKLRADKSVLLYLAIYNLGREVIFKIHLKIIANKIKHFI